MHKYCLGEIRAKTDRVPGCPEQKALLNGYLPAGHDVRGAPQESAIKTKAEGHPAFIIGQEGLNPLVQPSSPCLDKQQDGCEKQYLDAHCSSTMRGTRR